jgi:hypothetical protein
MELRMDETRYLASWFGGQEALHEQVLTLDDALAQVEAVTPTTPPRRAELFRDEAPARGGHAARRGRAWSGVLARVMSAPEAAPGRDGRPVDRPHDEAALRMGSLELARAS